MSAPDPLPDSRTSGPPKDWPLILMYHRVAQVDCDPWSMAVSPSNFEDQVRILKAHRDVVPLWWFVQELRAGRRLRNAAVITIDDGYADFALNAFPILRACECPHTLFVVSGWLGKPGFWWDVLSRILFETPALPDRLGLEVGGRWNEWRLLESQEGRSTDVGEIEPVTRDQLHLELWRILKPLAESDRRAILEELAGWAGASADHRPDERTLELEELRKLTASPLLEIGAHTVHHASLPALDPAQRREEITQSRNACEEISGRKVRGFSYPFGDFDDACAAMVSEAELQYACITKGGRIPEDADPFRLTRFNVANWSGAEFRKRLRI